MTRKGPIVWILAGLLGLGLGAPVRAVDCNGNGLEDAEDLSAQTSEDCNDNAIPDECEGPPLVFSSTLRLEVDNVARQIMPGDFDLDGRQDFAVGTSRSLVLKLNDGSGTAENYPETIVSVDSLGLRAWAHGHFDADDSTDFVALDTQGPWVLLGDGVGGVQAPLRLEQASGGNQLACGDLSGDGVDDLVIVTSRPQALVTVLVAAGDGSFGPAASLLDGLGPTAVGLGDLDGDGALDLAVLHRSLAAVSVVINDGAGTLVPAAPLTIGGDNPETLAVVDVDADGLADLAVGDRVGFRLYLNQGGTFSDAIDLVHAGAETSALTAGDLNGDGNVDLVGALRVPRSVAIFTGTGDGRFNSGFGPSLDTSSVGLAVADVDSDAAMDVITIPFGLKRVTAFRNDVQSRSLTVDLGSPITYVAEGRPHTGEALDFDGDGDVDVVTGNSFDQTISVLRNQGDGTFVATALRLSVTAFSVAAGDYDSDGDADLGVVGHGNRIILFENNGNAEFDMAGGIPLGQTAFHVAAADVTGDGRVEFIAALRGGDAVAIAQNTGGGSFGQTKRFVVGRAPRAVAAGDFDGDGLVDIVTANENSADLSVLFNDGVDGETVEFLSPLQVPLASSPFFVAAGDVDDDGHVDIIASSEVGRTVSVLWSDGAGGFLPPATWDLVHQPYSHIAVDLTADGLLEIISVAEISDRTESTTVVLENLSGRTFGPSKRFRVGSGPRFVVAADFDDDESLDLMSLNRGSSDVTVLLNESRPSSELDFLETVCTESDYFSISLPTSRRTSRRRIGKYVAPARDGEGLLGPLFQNANTFELHEEFLGTVFPEEFGFVLEDPAAYDDLVGRRATRDYYVGTLDLRQRPEGFLYTFNIFADTGFDSRETLSQEEVGSVFERLSASFSLRPLAYAPETQLAKAAAEEWESAPFPIFFDDSRPAFDYEAYTLSVGYGRVRLLTLEEFSELNSVGRFTFQDILVIDESPADIEGVVGGVITGTIQGELSHVAIRTARRGTPNAFVANAREEFSQYAGELVRLEVFPGEHFVTVVDASEAEEFWSQNRRELSSDPEIDTEYRGFDDLFELDVEAFGGRPESRYGGKASNFARLQRVLTGELSQYVESGFAIPASYYTEFMSTNEVELGGRSLTYEEWLFELLSDPAIESDSQARFEALEEFRSFVRANGVVDSELVSLLASRIESVFGDVRRMVRFRSSSNVEDALEFNGAGLYESTSVCAQDTLDPASPESSHCDASRSNERTIERALKKVWASLWTFRAHEERTFYQIDPSRAAMGILVSRAFLDELANGVAFTGNPRDVGDKRYVVTAQAGEASVVSPEPGTTVERSVLELDESGEVVRVIRSRASSLVEPGEVVLSEEKLRELGSLMWHVDQRLPLDLEGHAREEVILDFEFKVEPDGSLAVKQVRPFLIPSASIQTPTFSLEVPAGTRVCGVFSAERVNREPRVEYETKSVVELRAGVYELATSGGVIEADLIESLRFGSERSLAQPLGPGRFTVTPIPEEGSRTNYRFSYEQEFELAADGSTYAGGRLLVQILQLDYLGRGEVALDGAKVLDDEFLTFDLVMGASVDGEPLVGYSSCSYRELPRWELSVDLGGGSRVDLVERFLPSENLAATGPASLVEAVVELGGVRQSTRDYWRLVYTARRHNLDARYWVELDPLVEVEVQGEPRAVRVVELLAPEPPIGEDVDVGSARVRYLDENLEVLVDRGVVGFAKSEREVEPGERFVRGDVEGDGRVDVSDAIALLSYLFKRGAAPSCQKAADADDSGRLNVSDAVTVLLSLFAGTGPLPPPASVCGEDPTSDALSCETFALCE